MKSYKLIALCSTLTIAGWGCADQQLPKQVETPPSASIALLTPTRSNQFDPTTLQVGDRIQGLEVRQVDVQKAFDGSMVGTVAFQGEVLLTGTYRPHPQSPDVQSVCFDGDAASATQLPRFLNDDRKVWFCFENQEAAIQQLGTIGTTGKATIVIDQYTTIRQFTDAVDSAVLVWVVSKE
ncbi:hypothetical protein [Leptolyngbya sp. FACHB-711]|uniref:hypothetical protein n=1 Tax=unclassified Leptolyngbya TaxID=2650499 RepID=UPI001688BE64|nr:hypothetical protein [Leptolyngbya sp. FACHB-711]MBD1850536.1 hypothetical protein [Cyanobacteria bacterium FACHB-502]MBD2027341.1 hypothetical protein [Leptolyngbya sp. FACHB-711]